MKKCFWLFAAVGLLAVLAAAPGYAWQGRMAGMGDVYGLVEDESDFLTHPAGIAAGKGVNFYFDARAKYNETTKWDYSLSEANGSHAYSYSFGADGDEWYGEGLIGVAFPVGTGRAGIFFDYAGNAIRRGKYNGSEVYASLSGSSDLSSFDLKNDNDNYTIRFLYGMPVAPDFRLGAELQVSYKDEILTESFYTTHSFYQNYLWNTINPYYNLLPYGIPYDSQYLEAQAKLSAEGMIGPAKVSFTVKAGRPFGGINKYNYFNDNLDEVRMEGDVEGWNAGIDFWARYPLTNDLVVPIVISAGHKQIEKDGSNGVANWGPPWIFDYEQNVKTNYVSIGGGLDYTPCKGSRIAGGLYYDYLRTRQNMYQTAIGNFGSYYVMEAYDLSDYPDTTEHRITLKVAAEREFSPMFAMRGGLNLFYGWLYNDYSTSTYYARTSSGFELNENGSRIGIAASIGFSVKAGKVTIEPFLNGGYQYLKIDGDGSDMYYSSSNFATESDYKKTNWFIGGGFSLRF